MQLQWIGKPISRILSRTIIYLDHTLLYDSNELPNLLFHQIGFTPSCASLHKRVSSYLTVSTLPPPHRRIGGILSVALARALNMNKTLEGF